MLQSEMWGYESCISTGNSVHGYIINQESRLLAKPRRPLVRNAQYRICNLPRHITVRLFRGVKFVKPSQNTISYWQHMGEDRTHQRKLSLSDPSATVQTPGSEVLSFSWKTQELMAPVVFNGAVPLR